MASVVYLDTHVVAWLFAEGASAVPPASARMLATAEDIRISPMVRLELQYLFEIGRVTQPALPVIDALGSTLGLALCPASFAAVVRQAESFSWTRDPFDRIIVAHAALFNAPLITKDGSIQKHYPNAFWTEHPQQK